MSKRAPNGAYKLASQIEKITQKTGLKESAKYFQVSEGYLKRVIKASQDHKLGKVWSSKKAIKVWDKRIAGEGKRTTREPKGLVLKREKKPRPESPRPTPQAKEPKPIEKALAAKSKTSIEFTTDNKTAVIVLPETRDAAKVRGVDHVINKEFTSAADAARWISDRGMLRGYSFVGYDKGSGRWKIYVCKTERAVAQLVSSRTRKVQDVGEIENEY